jgi:hypothetical protein
MINTKVLQKHEDIPPTIRLLWLIPLQGIECQANDLVLELYLMPSIIKEDVLKSWMTLIQEGDDKNISPSNTTQEYKED